MCYKAAKAQFDIWDEYDIWSDVVIPSQEKIVVESSQRQNMFLKLPGTQRNMKMTKSVTGM